MKKILLIIVTFCFFIGCESMEKTDVSILNKPIVKIHNHEGMKKNTIYNKSLLWFAENFNSANDVLQLKDKKNGKIVAQCVGSVPYTVATATWNAYFTYTLKLDIKNYKSRFTFSNLQQKIVGGKRGLNPEFKEQYKLITEYLNKLSNDYKLHVNSEDKAF